MKQIQVESTQTEKRGGKEKSTIRQTVQVVVRTNSHQIDLVCMKYSMFVLQARIIRTGTRNDTLYTYEINQIDLVFTYRMKHSTFG